MQITVRNTRVLKMLGFEPINPQKPKMMASLFVSDWLIVIRHRLLGW